MTKTKSQHWRRILGVVAVAISTVLIPAQASKVLAAAATPNIDPDEEIVYIDGAGRIRVYDSRQTGSNPKIQWVSPEADGSFRGFALGDVNNDGDPEIIAIQGSSSGGKFIVYDPVVASGATDPNQEINGVPWAKLGEVALAAKPVIVGTGNLDAGVPGVEILIGEELAENQRPEPNKLARITIFKYNANAPGRWEKHIERYHDNAWSRVAIGDIFTTGSNNTDEIAYVSEDGGKFEIFRVDAGYVRIKEDGGQDNSYNDVVIGQFVGGGPIEVATLRDVDPPKKALVIRNYSADSEADVFLETFEPAPRRLVLLDTNGSGDDEAYMLRNVKDGTNSARLISRNIGADLAWTFEERLQDNDWKVLAGGDVDGDGRDELVMMRRDRIRIYIEPERNSTVHEEQPLENDGRSVAVGNLDAIGFISGPTFSVNVSKLEISVPRNDVSPQASFLLENSSTNDRVPFTIGYENNPGLLTVNPLFGFVPANKQPIAINYSVNAKGLTPGVYTARIIIDSTADVVNKPLKLDVVVTVKPSAITLSPSAVYAIVPCSPEITATAPLTRQVFVLGTSGVHYSATIIEPTALAAAEAALGDAATGASIDDAGVLYLKSAAGNSVAVDYPGLGRNEVDETAVSAAAFNANASWPSAVSWLGGESLTTIVPDLLTLSITPTLASGPNAVAQVLIIGDETTGQTPDNLRILPVQLCGAQPVYLPTISR